MLMRTPHQGRSMQVPRSHAPLRTRHNPANDAHISIGCLGSGYINDASWYESFETD